MGRRTGTGSLRALDPLSRRFGAPRTALPVPPELALELSASVATFGSGVPAPAPARERDDDP
jgi:hypothetical protein